MTQSRKIKDNVYYCCLKQWAIYKSALAVVPGVLLNILANFIFLGVQILQFSASFYWDTGKVMLTGTCPG